MFRFVVSSSSSVPGPRCGLFFFTGLHHQQRTKRWFDHLCHLATSKFHSDLKRCRVGIPCNAWWFIVRKVSPENVLIIQDFYIFLLCLRYVFREFLVNCQFLLMEEIISKTAHRWDKKEILQSSSIIGIEFRTKMIPTLWIVANSEQTSSKPSWKFNIWGPIKTLTVMVTSNHQPIYIGSVLVFHLPASIHAWQKANCSPKKWKSTITNFSPPFQGHLKPSWWFQDSFIVILTSGNDPIWQTVIFVQVGLGWNHQRSKHLKPPSRGHERFPPWSQGLLWWHHWEHFSRLLGKIGWTLPGVLDSNRSLFVVKFVFGCCQK